MIQIVCTKRKFVIYNDNCIIKNRKKKQDRKGDGLFQIVKRKKNELMGERGKHWGCIKRGEKNWRLG